MFLLRNSVSKTIMFTNLLTLVTKYHTHILELHLTYKTSTLNFSRSSYEWGKNRPIWGHQKSREFPINWSENNNNTGWQRRGMGKRRANTHNAVLTKVIRGGRLQRICLASLVLTSAKWDSKNYEFFSLLNSFLKNYER